MSNQGLEMKVAVPKSVKGLRDENQDSMSWKTLHWGDLFIVADGMGGYQGGAKASKMTVEGLEKHLTEMRGVRFKDALQEAVQRVNSEIYREANSGNPETEKMGSTVVVALISNGELQVGHIGDSRAYLFRQGRLKRLTKDHTTVQRMLDAGMINAEEAKEHPDASVLSRAVGSQAEVEIEIEEPIKLEEGDALLLCSDGLSGFVEDRQIRKTLQRESDTQRVPDELVKLALDSGSDDNITVQFARFGRPTRRWPPLAVLTLIAVVLGGLGLYLFAPPTLEFTVSKETVQLGETTQLRWNAHFAQKVQIRPEVGEVKELDGSEDVHPSKSTTYVATASRFWGTITKTIVVNVATPPATPVPTINFTASKTTDLKPGESIKLEWNAQNTSKVHIEPDIGDVSASGSKDVKAKASVTYTAIATGTGGMASKEVSVKVGSTPPPKKPTIDFHASKTSLNAGESIKLQWNAKNADKVHIDPSIGDLPANGSKDVQPTTSIRYTAIATGQGGSATKEISITVVPPTPPPAAKPTIAFTASKTTIQPGESIQLHWDTQNADRVHIDPDVGDYPSGSGFRTVLPTTTVTYKATAIGPGGNATKEVSVTVVPPQPTIDFRPSKTSLNAGESIQLIWNTQNATKVHIEPEIGDVSPNGSKEVTPKTSAKYIATATGPGGSKSAQVSVTVASASPAQAPALTFTAKKTGNFLEGKKIELTWDAENAEKVYIESDVPVDPPLGDVQNQGELRVKPQKSVTSVTFKATATGPGGRTVKTEKVQIKAESQ